MWKCRWAHLPLIARPRHHSWMLKRPGADTNEDGTVAATGDIFRFGPRTLSSTIIDES